MVASFVASAQLTMTKASLPCFIQASVRELEKLLRVSIEQRRHKRWIALSRQQLEFCIPTRTIALGWRNKKGQLKYALLVVTDLHSSLADLSRFYNFRGAAEIDIPMINKGSFSLTTANDIVCLLKKLWSYLTIGFTIYSFFYAILFFLTPHWLDLDLIA